MKNISPIGLLFILILLVSLQANSQMKSSATQTVTFAVNRSATAALKVFANSPSLNLSSNSSGMIAFRNSLEKMSVKVTIAETSTHTTAVSKNASDVHMDVRSVFQTRNSATIDRIPTVVTVTE
jgi:hypothetical protein